MVSGRQEPDRVGEKIDNFLAGTADAFVVKCSDLSELVETVLLLATRRAP